jgi:hypothetical protein
MAGGGNIDDGAFDKGSDNDEAAASARREYASAASDKDEASAPTARCVRTASAARGTAEGGYIVDGTSDKGSDDNKAAESAARHAYASAASDEDEASAPAARHLRAASAARGTAEGGYIVDGTSNEGSDDDEAKASTARRAYVASAASDDDEAVATAKRHACAAMAARHADGGHLRQHRLIAKFNISGRDANLYIQIYEFKVHEESKLASYCQIRYFWPRRQLVYIRI